MAALDAHRALGPSVGNRYLVVGVPVNKLDTLEQAQAATAAMIIVAVRERRSSVKTAEKGATFEELLARDIPRSDLYDMIDDYTSRGDLLVLLGCAIAWAADYITEIASYTGDSPEAFLQEIILRCFG